MKTETWKRHKTAAVMVSSAGRYLIKNIHDVWVETELDADECYRVLVGYRWKDWDAHRVAGEMLVHAEPAALPDSIVWLEQFSPAPVPEPETVEDNRDAAHAPTPELITPKLTPAALNLLGIQTLDPQHPKSIWAGNDKYTCPVCGIAVSRKGKHCGSYSCRRVLRRGGHRTFTPPPRKSIDFAL